MESRWCCDKTGVARFYCIRAYSRVTLKWIQDWRGPAFVPPWRHRGTTGPRSYASFINDQGGAGLGHTRVSTFYSCAPRLGSLSSAPSRAIAAGFTIGLSCGRHLNAVALVRRRCEVAVLERLGRVPVIVLGQRPAHSPCECDICGIQFAHGQI